MLRTTYLGRGFVALAMVLALTLSTPTARADAVDDPEPDGWGNVVNYSMFAAGIALAKDPLSALSAIQFCWTLFRDAP